MCVLTPRPERPCRGRAAADVDPDGVTGHARAHACEFHSGTGHAIARSAVPGADWQTFRYEPAAEAVRASAGPASTAGDSLCSVRRGATAGSTAGSALVRATAAAGAVSVAGSAGIYVQKLSI